MQVPSRSTFRSILQQGCINGSVAALLSTAVLLLAGRRQAGNMAAPVNAVGHWLLGDAALQRTQPDPVFTPLGYATQHAASVFWGTLHAAAMAQEPALRTPAGAAASAAGTSALAWVVDYKVVPKRLTPGFEHRISSGAMWAVYGALALGMAAGALGSRGGRRD